MIFILLATVKDGKIQPKEPEAWERMAAALEGQAVMVKLDTALKTPAQLGHYRRVILPAITKHFNQTETGTCPQCGLPMPRSEDEVHWMLKRAFLGVEPDEPTLKPKSSSRISRAERSKFIDDVQAYYSDLGVVFDSEEHYP